MASAHSESNPSKASYVLRQLRTDIISGALAPGRKLNFGLLTGRYGVGVSPIREALFECLGTGLVALESQRGFHVAPVSRADLEDVTAMRRHIEIHALGLSIRRGGEGWRAQVRQALREFLDIAARAGDARIIDESWQEIHRHFHFSLIGACGSPILLDFCAQIYDRFDRYRRLAVPTQSHMAGTASDHKALASLAVAGECEKAQAILKRHIEDISEVVITNLPPAGQDGIGALAKA